MPTGVAIRDPREQLFAAAERVLLRDGPDGLTSRAVTAEAAVAKGVLHRHFASFDDFLAGLVLDRAVRLGPLAARLREQAGTGTVTGNLAAALTGLFGPVAVAVVALVISRDGLRSRLRQAGQAGIPLLGDGVAMLAGYLAAEQELGRIAESADPAMLAPALVGTGHLLFADRQAAPPSAGAVAEAVTVIVGPVLAAGPAH